MTFATVAVNVPVRKTFDYSVPAELVERIGLGMRVKVPFGPRKMIGYCVGLPVQPAVAIDKVKPIIDVLDEYPVISEKLLKLTRWIASYYYCSWGEAISAALPSGVRSKVRSNTQTVVELDIPPEQAWSQIEEISGRRPKQANVLRAAAEAEGPMTLREMARAAHCSDSTVSSAVSNGYLRMFQREVKDDLLAARDIEAITAGGGGKHPVKLTGEQETALANVKELLEAGEFATMLLHGVTGSGKTEIYLRGIRQVVDAGGQAIVLVPEIALTPQTVRRFRRRFRHVAVLHSHLTDSARHKQWRAIREGKAEVIVGARSALFAPAANLRLIVVDEEQETSFKQESTPRYHARDVAVMRAKMEDAVCVLGSATPSLESYHNAKSGRYRLAVLDRRVEKMPMPNIELVDMSAEMAEVKYQRYISRRLQNLAITALERGEQVILFLNRRGFSTHVHCLRCRSVIRCRNCDITLTYHRRRGKLMCHYCNFEMKPPTACPDCNARTLRYSGMGTERIEDEVKRTFPGYTFARMDSDTMRQRELYERVLDDFREGRTDILIGTQMIAKGLHFPDVTLVGVIAADSALSLPDFRAAERTFQLVAQVAGRTGRGPKGGRVLVQAFTPQHYSVRLSAEHDYHGFAEEELAHREELIYPPFGRLARILLQGKDDRSVREMAREIGDRLKPGAPDYRSFVLGPVPCPIERIKEKFRMHIMVKAPGHRELRAVLDPAEDLFVGSNKVNVAVDVDAIGML